VEEIAGWKVLIEVPQPNGGRATHLWIAAIPDAGEVRSKLLLVEIPCEARLEALSAAEVRQLRLDPGEVRRLVDGSTDYPANSEREQSAASTAETSGQADDSSPSGTSSGALPDPDRRRIEAILSAIDATNDVSYEASQANRSGDRIWQRLWPAKKNQNA